MYAARLSKCIIVSFRQFISGRVAVGKVICAVLYKFQAKSLDLLFSDVCLRLNTGYAQMSTNIFLSNRHPRIPR